MQEAEHEARRTEAQLILLHSITELTRAQGIAIALHGGLANAVFNRVRRTTQDIDFLIDEDQADRATELIEYAGTAWCDAVAALGQKAIISPASIKQAASGLIRAKLDLPLPSGSRQRFHIEFWPADAPYVRRYRRREISAALPHSRQTIRISTRAPDRGTALAEKLVAISARPYLKIRDVYDFVELAGGSDIPDSAIVDMAVEQLAAYSPLEIERVECRIRDIEALKNPPSREALIASLSPFVSLTDLSRFLVSPRFETDIDYLLELVHEFSIQAITHSPDPSEISRRYASAMSFCGGRF